MPVNKPMFLIWLYLGPKWDNPVLSECNAYSFPWQQLLLSTHAKKAGYHMQAYTTTYIPLQLNKEYFTGTNTIWNIIEVTSI